MTAATRATPAQTPAKRKARPRTQLSLAKLTPWLLTGIIVVGFVLRLHRIGDKGLWLDEAFSVWMARNTLPELIAWLLRVDQHPPLYYALLHLWLWFGDSAAHVRTLSALFGTLTLPVIFLLGRRISGNAAGLIAALILALSPFHVRFAQETRMYTLLTLNVSLATLALVYLLSDPRTATIPFGRQFGAFLRTWRTARAVDRAAQSEAQDRAAPAPAASALDAPISAPTPTSAPTQVGYRRDFRGSTAWVAAPTQRRWLPLRELSTDLAWVAYMLFTAGAVLTHNTAIFFPIATNLFVIGFIVWRKVRTSRHREHGQPAPGPSAPSPALFAPPSLANWIIAQIGAFLLWSPWLVAFVIQSMGVYAEFWIPAPTWETVVETLKTLLLAFLPRQITWDELIWSACALLVLLGVVHLRKRMVIAVFLALLFLTPFVGEWLVSLRRPIFYDRTLIWTTIPLYLLMAFGFVQLHFRPYILAGLLMLATLQGLALRDYYDHFEKEQWREAAAYVAQNVQDNDLILFNATWVQIPFDFYYRNYNRPTERRGAPVDLFDRGILEPKMAEADLPRLRSLLRDRERVWLVYSHDWYTDPQKLIPAALDEELDLLDQRSFFGLELRLYGLP